MLADALAVDASEVKLQQSDAAKMGKVLPATKVARYLQIENKIRAIVKFELAAQISLASSGVLPSQLAPLIVQPTFPALTSLVGILELTTTTV